MDGWLGTDADRHDNEDKRPSLDDDNKEKTFSIQPFSLSRRVFERERR